MALELHRNLSEWIYRINEHDDRLIQRRRLTKGARWEIFLRCATAEVARQIILVMTEEQEK